MLKGFKLLSIEPNNARSDFNIFNFEKSKNLKKAIDQYQNIKDFLI